MQFRERHTWAPSGHKCGMNTPHGVIEIKAEAQFRSQRNRRHARMRAECFNALCRHVDWP